MIEVVVEGWVRNRWDDESGEVTFVWSGHRFTAESRQFGGDWGHMRAGPLLAFVRFSRWHDARGALIPVLDAAAAPGLVQVDDGLDRATGTLLRFEPEQVGRAAAWTTSYVAHLDIGLAEPLAVQSYLASECDGLTIGDRVSVEGVLEMFPHWTDRPVATEPDPETGTGRLGDHRR